MPRQVATFPFMQQTTHFFINPPNLHPLQIHQNPNQEKQKILLQLFLFSRFRKMPGLTIGDLLPNLEVETTHGKMKLHDYVDDSFTIIFSHPGHPKIKLSRSCMFFFNFYYCVNFYFYF